MTPPRFLAGALVAAGVSLAVFASSASAQSARGITVVSPKSGKTVAVGERPTFKMRVRGPGQVWVHVCKSKAKDSDGVICSDESIGRASKKGSQYQYKPRFFDFPEFWLNSPGTYYWQAHRIDCAGDPSDCRQEGPIIRFKVG
jgi:hypothetical protein